MFFILFTLWPHTQKKKFTPRRYEGTGRSLSLKLIQQLRTQSNQATGESKGRVLKEVELKEPIRYAAGDHVEKWMVNFKLKINWFKAINCINISLSPFVPHFQIIWSENRYLKVIRFPLKRFYITVVPCSFTFNTFKTFKSFVYLFGSHFIVLHSIRSNHSFIYSDHFFPFNFLC